VLDMEAGASMGLLPVAWGLADGDGTDPGRDATTEQPGQGNNEGDVADDGHQAAGDDVEQVGIQDDVDVDWGDMLHQRLVEREVVRRREDLEQEDSSAPPAMLGAEGGGVLGGIRSDGLLARVRVVPEGRGELRGIPDRGQLVGLQLEVARLLGASARLACV